MRIFALILIFLLTNLELFAQTQTVFVKVVLNGTGLSNQDVDFLKFTSEGEPLGIISAKTDLKGIAKAKIDTEAQSFAVRAIYQSVSYFSDIFPSNTKQIPDLAVFKSSREAKSIIIEDLRVFAYPIEEGVLIRQEFVIKNSDKSTYVGSNTGDKAETFRFSLPSSAFELERGMGISDENTRIENNDVIINTPIVPGQTRFSLSYKMEKKRGSVDFSQKFSLPLELLSLGISDPTVKPRFGFDTKTFSKFYEGQLISTYAASFHDRKMSELQFKISGLPLNIRFSQWMPFIVLALLLSPLLFRRSRPTQLALTNPERLELIRELKNLETLKSQKVIEDSEYQLRRLLLLEKLWPSDESA